MELHRKQLFEKVLANIGELHRCFATSRDSFLAQFKLTRPQMELLFSIKHGKLSTGEIAKRFSVTSSAVSQMVDQLERKKLVERIQDPNDRRITYIGLATEARKVFEAMRTKYIQHLSSRFTEVSDSELETLHTILEKTINNVGKDTAWKN